MIAKIKRHKMLAILPLAILAAAGVLAIAWSNLRPSAGESATAKKNNVITLKKQNLIKSISATGTVKSADSRTVSAQATNLTVKKVKVKVGDQVKKGDSLVTFDQSDLKDALADAKENLTTAKADSSRSVTSATQQLSTARETYASEQSKSARAITKAKDALADAKKQIATLKKQIQKAKNAAKKKELQEQLSKAQEGKTQAQTTYENAISNRDSSSRQNKSSVQNAENALANANSSAQKSIREAESQVEQAQKNLKNCAVTAPISGIVTTVNVTDGDTYSGGSLFQIDDTSSFTVTTTVDEYDISNVSVGQRAVILTEATDQQEIQGKISFVAPSTDSTSSDSSTSSGNGSGAVMASTSTSSSDGYEVVIDITDSNDKLKMGLTAKCSLILEEATDVFAVPYDAIHKNDSGNSVIRVAENASNTEKFQEIAVTKGMESDYYVEISADSLKEGMLVIIPTDETEESSQENESEKNGFNFGNGQGMPGGNMNRGNKGSRNGSGGGNPPAAPRD